MEKLKLFRIYDVECDGGFVTNAKKEFIAELENEDDALKYPKMLEELYIIKFDENDDPIGIHGMVFGECDLYDDTTSDEPTEVLPPATVVAEPDLRVFASVSFGTACE